MAAKKPQVSKGAVSGLFVRSFEKTFRRAGRRFDRAGTFIPLSDLKPDEIKALKADPNLVVDEREGEVVDAGADTASDAAGTDAGGAAGE